MQTLKKEIIQTPLSAKRGTHFKFHLWFSPHTHHTTAMQVNYQIFKSLTTYFKMFCFPSFYKEKKDNIHTGWNESRHPRNTFDRVSQNFKHWKCCSEPVNGLGVASQSAWLTCTLAYEQTLRWACVPSLKEWALEESVTFRMMPRKVWILTKLLSCYVTIGNTLQPLA